MMSQEYIKAESDRHAREALVDGIEPYQPYDIAEVNTWELIPIPFPVLGDYIPDGYEQIDTLFCDSSGFGEERELALNKRQLSQYVKDHINDGFYYGLGDVGQFQLYVNVYAKL